ncbi:MAG: YmdB family metallophosphoesterase [Treponema sp.]|jgi:metallophosphoesterase (TIGR00282 family)|nr:YmdB family metallophosphoesterase [Treponema sp.]
MVIFYVAEIVGKAGVYALKQGLPKIKARHKVDFTIACADGATGGNGLGRSHAAYLRKLGCEVLTLGERCFYKKDLTENIDKLPYVLRPANLRPEAPGRGLRVYKAAGAKVGVAVLLGQSCFDRTHGDNPYAAFPLLAERLRAETPIVIFDFHAQATGEKQTLFHLAAGHCSAVLGSHTRVQTTDERIVSGTALVTDAGRTGSADSVGGADPAARIGEYLSGIPDWTREAYARPELQGVLIEVDEATGRARAITRVKEPLPELAAPNAADNRSSD